MATARDEILNSLRAAIAKQRPFESTDTNERTPLQPVARIGDDEDLRARFIAEVERVKGVVHLAESDADARRILRELLTQKDVHRVTMWDADELPLEHVDALVAEMNIERVQGEDDVVATADAGITGADWAIAATGTLVLSSGSGKPRMASLLPPIHVAIVTTDQLVPRLEDYIAGQRADKLSTFRTSSNVTLITGCSRTSDIEMQTVFGVHGPLELHIILIENLN
jgi:L-lactate dehydrogenase complex protein LldG